MKKMGGAGETGLSPQGSLDLKGPRDRTCGMKSGNKILLTGATGFVGRSLWPALARQGYQVRSMTRDVESARRKVPPQEWVLGDMRHS